MGCLIDYLCQRNFECYTVQMSQIWVFNNFPPPSPSPPPQRKNEIEHKRMIWRCFPPFVTQSGYGRCGLRSFEHLSICNFAWNEFANPRENGLNEMAEGKEPKFSRLAGLSYTV